MASAMMGDVLRCHDWAYIRGIFAACSALPVSAVEMRVCVCACVRACMCVLVCVCASAPVPPPLFNLDVLLLSSVCSAVPCGNK